MHVNVKYALSSVRVRVDHRAIPAVADTLLLRDFGGKYRHSPHNVRIAELVERRHVLSGDDEHVRRRLRIDVAEGDTVVGLRDDLRRDLVADDATEKAVVSHACSPRWRRKR